MAITIEKVPKGTTNINNRAGKGRFLGGGMMMFGNMMNKMGSLYTGATKKATSIYSSAIKSGAEFNSVYQHGGAKQAFQSAGRTAGRTAQSAMLSTHGALKGSGAYEGAFLGAAYGAGSDDTSVVGGALMGGGAGYAGLKAAKYAKQQYRGNPHKRNPGFVGPRVQ